MGSPRTRIALTTTLTGLAARVITKKKSVYNSGETPGHQHKIYDELLLCTNVVQNTAIFQIVSFTYLAFYGQFVCNVTFFRAINVFKLTFFGFLLCTFWCNFFSCNSTVFRFVTPSSTWPSYFLRASFRASLSCITTIVFYSTYKFHSFSPFFRAASFMCIRLYFNPFTHELKKYILPTF